MAYICYIINMTAFLQITEYRSSCTARNMGWTALFDADRYRPKPRYSCLRLFLPRCALSQNPTIVCGVGLEWLFGAKEETRSHKNWTIQTYNEGSKVGCSKFAWIKNFCSRLNALKFNVLSETRDLQIQLTLGAHADFLQVPMENSQSTMVQS